MKLLNILWRCVLIPLSAFALSYTAACVYWFSTGCRYGVKRCTVVFKTALPYSLIAASLFVIVISVRAIMRTKRFYEALENCRLKKADEGSVEQLDRELAAIEKDPEYRKLLKASALLSCEAYDKCCEALGELDFKELTAAEEEEYFNMLVYCQLMMGDRRKAVEIYYECGHYFKRALSRFGTEHIRHTVGMIYYAVGDLGRAKQLFIEARRSTNKELRCDCDLWIALCCLRAGLLEQAKQTVILASHEVTIGRQQRELEHLKKAVYAAFSKNERISAGEALQTQPGDNV